MQQKKTYSVADYARMRDVDRTSVYRWIKSGEVETITDRGKMRIVVQEEIPDEEAIREAALASEVVELLREKLREKDEQIKVLLERQEKLDGTIRQQNESIQQQNAIVMQMTRNTESAQKLLEYHETPFWRRIFPRRKPVE